ncbi:DUF892 family protein [Pseudomonas sp. NFACC25]|uniref:DUF892 family protein n=1 Tax=Pseudomonas sp. NFACC25 TaxID=1566188 RepID=UPI003532093F
MRSDGRAGRRIQRALEEIEKGDVLDAGPIGTAQKVEHYEIASYGTLIAMAKHLNLARCQTPRRNSC